LDEFTEIAFLLDFYGPLLTKRQQEIMDLHFNSDLSLAEIAEGAGMTRQGAYDAIRKAKASLRRYEGLLGLAERFRAERRKVEDLLAKNDPKEIKAGIKDLFAD
jgi:predicted DNA-binding protein YlxM (UPF0122 family)